MMLLHKFLVLSTLDKINNVKSSTVVKYITSIGE
ncbi:unnamed protein product [Arabidopsis halleri]